MAKIYNNVVRLGETKQGVNLVSLSGGNASVAFNAVAPLSSSTTTVQFANSAVPAVSGDMAIDIAYVGQTFEVIVGVKSFEFTFTTSNPLSSVQGAVETTDGDTFWDPERRRRRLLGYI